MRDRWILLTIVCVLIPQILSCSVKKNSPQENQSTEFKSMEHTNLLINEKSPYLLQHAHNPVNWYPWGKPALEKAAKENKPIFLSIGYSTCHWCHVMEHESFEDEETARILNEYFIPIKVDREERPDLDQIYMTAVSMMNGQGGWPLNVFLTPDKKPFYGGTYFPPQSRYGMPGFKDVLRSIHDAWEKRPGEIVRSGDSLVSILKEQAASSEKGALSDETLKKAFQQFSNYFDERHGGFGQQPKFPSSHNLSFLLRYWKRASSQKALDMVEKTLTEMQKGGIYDHLGGGFHRYSTDEMWQIPHFEKMLYDQAVIARTYLEAYQATGNNIYSKTASEIFDYVLRDMTSSEGGFFSAEDADSFPFDSDSKQSSVKKEEGAFYLWTYDDLIRLLGPRDSPVFNYYFGIEPNGNAQFDPHGEFVGKNILYIAHSPGETAAHFSISEKEVSEIISRGSLKLFQERIKRPRPHLDDKILVDWNGLMISSLAFGGGILNDRRYTQSAQTAVEFILRHLKTPDGRLLHRYRDGQSAIDATLSDYAFFIQGLLDLYETTFQPEYLNEAIHLSEKMVELFWDDKNGGFFLAAHDREDLILRPKEIYDGASPSGNSIAALDLIRLAHFTMNTEWDKKAQKLFEFFYKTIEATPSAYAQTLTALDFILGPSREIIIAGEANDALVEEMLENLRRKFIPNKVIILRPADLVGEKKSDLIFSLIPSLKDQIPVNNQTTAYICINHVCQLPVTTLKDFEKLTNDFH